MSRIVDVVLLAALTFTALAWALDLGSRKTQLMIATGMVLALDAVAIWQDKPWYIVVIYGGLTGPLLHALRREIIRHKAAKTVSKPTS